VFSLGAQYYHTGHYNLHSDTTLRDENARATVGGPAAPL